MERKEGKKMKGREGKRREKIKKRIKLKGKI
jgi:hypothetical protein